MIAGYVVNCSILLTDLPVLQRPAAARTAGFEAVEFWWPFAEAVPPTADVEAFVSAIGDAGVRLAGLNFFAGDMPAGDRGVVSWPGREQEFRESVELAVEIGERLGVGVFNALYGNRVVGAAPADQDRLAHDNLTVAAGAASRIGATVLVEAVSGAERYPLTRAGDVRAVLDRLRTAGVPNVGMLADLYHLAVNGEDVGSAIVEHRDVIAHVQVADAPGRGAPGTGELPIAQWLSELDCGGEDGFVGLEYLPGDAGRDPFEWLPRAGRGPTDRTREGTA